MWDLPSLYHLLHLSPPFFISPSNLSLIVSMFPLAITLADLDITGVISTKLRVYNDVNIHCASLLVIMYRTVIGLFIGWDEYCAAMDLLIP